MLGREPSAAVPIRSTSPIPEGPQGGLKASEFLCFKVDNKSIVQPGRGTHASRLTERSLNVYENKGMLWKRGGEPVISKRDG